MPLFPILDLEALVQERDKTRLDASKSFASGVDPICSMTIKPGKNAPVIQVKEAGYLDWVFNFTIDVDAENCNIDFSEGGAPLLAVVPTLEYTLATLAPAIQAAMRLAGTLAYVVSVSPDDRITIAAPAQFSLLPISGAHLATSLLLQCGFTPLLPVQSVLVSDLPGKDWTGKASYQGYVVETVLKKVILTVSNDPDDMADADATDALAGDGTPDDVAVSMYIGVISKQADKLFSTDDNLRKHESDVAKYIPDGRASFLDVHRRAQTLILAWLDTQGFIDDLGYKFTKRAILGVQGREEFAEWSAMMVLRLISENAIIAVDDQFQKKAERYGDLEAFYRGRAIIRLDMNQDGRTDVSETLDIHSGTMVRR